MYLPLYFKNGLPCLVVGGGRIASHKIEILLKVPCDITVIAPEVSDYAAREIHGRSVRWLEREYAEGDCRGYQLVVAATPVRDVNRRISEEAKSLGIPVNVVDDPELSTVIFAATWREESLSIAVSTDGVAPFMAAEIRTLLGDYAKGMGEWVEAAGRFRDAVRMEVPDLKERNALFRKFMDAGRSPQNRFPSGLRPLRDWLLWLEKESG